MILDKPFLINRLAPILIIIFVWIPVGYVIIDTIMHAEALGNYCNESGMIFRGNPQTPNCVMYVDRYPTEKCAVETLEGSIFEEYTFKLGECTNVSETGPFKGKLPDRFVFNVNESLFTQ